MFSERMHNWAKIFELFTGAMNAIAIGVMLQTGALRSTGPQARMYRTSVLRSSIESQREWAMANARIVSLNR
jgi:hypothetical protein